MKPYHIINQPIMTSIQLAKKTTTETGSSKISLKIKTKGDIDATDELMNTLEAAVALIKESKSKGNSVDLTPIIVLESTLEPESQSELPSELPSESPSESPFESPFESPSESLSELPSPTDSKSNIFTHNDIPSIRKDINRIFTFNVFRPDFLSTIDVMKAIYSHPITNAAYLHIICHLDLEGSGPEAFIFALIRELAGPIYGSILSIGIKERPILAKFITDGMSFPIIEWMIDNGRRDELNFFIFDHGMMTTEVNNEILHLIIRTCTNDAILKIIKNAYGGIRMEDHPLVYSKLMEVINARYIYHFDNNFKRELAKILH